MHNLKFHIILSLLLLTTILGCSGASSSNCVTPVTENPSVKSLRNSESISTPVLAGLYEFYISENGEVSVSPIRHADYAFNIVSMIDSPPFSIGVEVNEFEHVGDHTNFYFNLSITHPVYGEEILTAFDLCGIFMGSADITHPHDPSLSYPQSLRIINADGYTRWMNRPEFESVIHPIFGYRPGVVGTPGFNPTSTLNPYKYYTDGLGPYDNAYDFLADNSWERGVFSSYSTNTRNYQLQFDDVTGFEFQYAILAHWAPNVNSPDPPTEIPGDFPEEANASEPVAISVTNDTSTMWFDTSDSSSGGNFTADISIINWHTQPDSGNLIDDYNIFLYSNAWPGASTPDMHCTDYGDNRATFHVDVSANPIAIGQMEIWITVERVGETYANPFGIVTGADSSPLAAHFKYMGNVISGGTPTDWEPPTDHDPRFLFIHHSVGEGFLVDGGMWGMLEAAGFDVHDRTYGDGWVGENTDPENFPTTFTEYYNDMITWELDPGQYYDIVAFKSCYPASAIDSEDMLNDYYGYYNTIKTVTNAHPETLFVPFSTPPLVPGQTCPEDAARARTFANWLTGPYDETGNMAAYDVFNVLAGSNPASGDYNCLRYDYQVAPDNSHPNTAGSTAVAVDFTAWLTSVVWD